MLSEEFTYGFIGFGHMGEILFSAMKKAHLIAPKKVLFTRKDKKKKVQTEMKHKITGSSLNNLVSKSDVLFFCVKPQNIEEVLQEIPEEIDLSKKLIVSILAGTKLEKFTKALGEVQVLRVMPNVPSVIGEGMNILSWGKGVSHEHHHLGKMLFSPLGKVHELPESFMDLVTGLCGSGVGFVYKLIEAMAKFGRDQGLSYEDSLMLVAQTFIGGAKLIQSGEKPEKLIDEISLPGGTTVEGFAMMEQKKIGQHLQLVLEKAVARAKELSR